MPAGFRVGTLNVDVYSPLRLTAASRRRRLTEFSCFGRLRSGVSLETARAEMAVIAGQVGREDPGEKEFGVVLISLRDYLVRDTRLVLLVLTGVVAFVLLIACANLAGLLLTRGVGRQSELALRASLGASRRRLVQQLLAESVALSAMGGALGVLLGSWTSRALVFLARDAVAFGQMADVHLDWRVLAFTVAISLLTAIVFGLAPAWQATRVDLQDGLQAHGRRAGQSRPAAIPLRARCRRSRACGRTAGWSRPAAEDVLPAARREARFSAEQALTMRMLVTGETGSPSRLWSRAFSNGSRRCPG